MKDFIEFKTQDATLPTYMRFAITKSAFEKLLNHPRGPRAILTELSASPTLLITKGRGEGLYEVYTKDGSYLCKIPDEFDKFVILGFYNNTLIKQNNAMKNGVCFKVTSGIIVEVRMRSSYNYEAEYINGYEYPNNNSNSVWVAESIGIIKEQVDLASVITDESEEATEEEYQPERRLSNLLQISEHYSILASELEERNANAVGKIPYFKIEAMEYDRVDRVAYRILVDEIDESIYKIGVRLDIEDNSGHRHSGEIIGIEANETSSAIDLLFNEQMDIDLLPRMGWVSLTFSTVNKDVQLAANEKIRNGEATAKYMDTVLGKRSSAGFENKDLSETKAGLLKKEYPPNESQMDAIFSGICARDAFLVMGPPGTGKTTVILEWAKYFIKKEHKRVLISSQNNNAVDNVLSRIADEKDIDIIRIGSESKLQSEVKPYMFENKVRDLRESIVYSTGSNIEKIKDISDSWEAFLSGLALLIELNRQVEALGDDFRNIIEKQIVPKYNQLLKYHEAYGALREKIDSIEKNLRKRIKRVDEYDSQGDKKKKFFFAIPNFTRNIMIKRDVAKLDKLRAEEETIVAKYNDTYEMYTSIYQRTRDEEFTMYHERSIGRDRTIEEMAKNLPQRENKWNLFSHINIDERDWRNSKALIDVQAKIEKESDRAEKLIEAIDTWRDEMGATQNYALNEIVLESVDLVGATCIGINSQRRFANLDFDVTIIDEAGQIQIHNALVPMSVSNKLIMLGDHKQIPPMVDQELLDLCEENGVDTELLEKSLFEKMYNEIPEENKIMLDTQYRMPSEIADIISEWFYDGQYLSADFKKNQTSEIPKLSEKPFVIIDTSDEANRFEKRIPEAGSNNNLEADIIKNLMHHIALTGEMDLKNIGIISAYNSQVKLIKAKLAGFLSSELVDEMVATLDSFQGQERDLIIYSFTKSSSRAPKARRIGFLNELRRLNVAMTRCIKTLVLIGDMEFLSSCQHMDKDDDGEFIYERSEKQFSDFITKMLGDVKGGRGEIMSYREFVKRMDGGSK